MKTPRIKSETLQLGPNLKVKAEWTLVDSPKAFALILPGSGNVGLDGDISHPLMGTGFNHQPAKLSEQMSQALAEAPVSSFRFEKRGFADPNHLGEQRLPFLLEDARTALLEVQKMAKGQKVLLVGFSEGALFSALLAADIPVDGLYLFALPFRGIDETLNYQFLQWPIEWLSRQLNSQQDLISEDAWAANRNFACLPLLGEMFADISWQDFLASKKTSNLSVKKDILPLYQELYKNVMKMLEVTPWDVWLQSMRTLPSLASFARKIKCPIFLYHGEEDAQISLRWVQEDLHLLGPHTQLKIFAKLGHSFAPMAGPLRSQRTSGPFQQEVLQSLTSCLRLFLK